MTNRPPSVNDIVNQLPQKLQLRFNSLGNYVQGIIAEQRAELKVNRGLSADEIQLVQLAVFIYLLDNFLREGSRAARTACTTFEQFNMSGFQVGSSVFTRNNVNTRRGEELANQLRRVILQTPLGVPIQEASSVRGLVARLLREMETNG